MSKKFVFGFLVLSFLIFAPSILAQGNSQANRPSPRPTPVRALNEVRLRACEANQASIQTRMRNLVRLSENMERAFDSIAQRVMNFYEDKVLPSGKTVSNYQALVDDIAEKKAMVDSNTGEVQGKVNAFGCEADDPRGLANEFRVGMQGVKTDLRNYRTSIKNLIMAVRRVAPKESPTPSVLPTVVPTATP